MFNDGHGNVYRFIACLSVQNECTVWKATKLSSTGTTESTVIVKEFTVYENVNGALLLNSVYRRFFIQHPHIVNQLSAFVKYVPPSVAKEGSYPTLCVVEECFSSCYLDKLLDFLNSGKVKALGLAQISSILYEICLGMSYLHQEMQTAHRSLSAKKVMLDREHKTVKISIIDGDDTVSFPSPAEKEIHSAADLQSDPMIKSIADDIWCLGVIAVELVAANACHLEDVTKQMIDDFSIIWCSVETSLFTASYVGSTARNFSITPELLDFISCCLRKDPALRPKVGRIMEHRLFNVGTCRDPSARRANMESLMRSIRKCFDSKEIHIKSCVPSRPHAAAASNVHSFRWAFPASISSLVKAPKESTTIPAEDQPSVNNVEDSVVQEAIKKYKRTLQKIETSPLPSAATSRKSLQRDSAVTSIKKSLRRAATPASPLVEELMKSFTHLQHQNSQFANVFCNTLASNLLRSPHQLSSVAEAVQRAESLATATRQRCSPAGHLPERIPSAADADPLPSSAVVNDGGWNRVPRMPIATDARGCVNVPHYLFNRWLQEKQSVPYD